MLKRRFGSALRSTQLTNLTLLALAALHGEPLQPAALARRLQTQTTFRHNEKRVHRFVGNRRLPSTAIYDRLLGMILALGPKGKLIPLTTTDETDPHGGCEANVAAITHQGRALPFAFSIFRYDRMPASQSVIERENYRLIPCLLRFHPLQPKNIMDRGYADIQLIRYFTQELNAHHITPAPGND